MFTNIIKLFSKLLEILDDVCIVNVQYSSWTKTNWSTLQMVTFKGSNFINELCSKLEIKPYLLV